MYKTADDQYQVDQRAFSASGSTDGAAALKIDSAFGEKVAAAAAVAAKAAAKDNKWDALNQALHRATKADLSIIAAECAKAG